MELVLAWIGLLVFSFLGIILVVEAAIRERERYAYEAWLTEHES